MFTGPVGPVKVFFTGPKCFFLVILKYWPGAIGSMLVSSPAHCFYELFLLFKKNQITLLTHFFIFMVAQNNF